MDGWMGGRRGFHVRMWVGGVVVLGGGQVICGGCPMKRFWESGLWREVGGCLHVSKVKYSHVTYIYGARLWFLHVIMVF